MSINAQKENKDKPRRNRISLGINSLEDAGLTCLPAEFHPHRRSSSLKKKKKKKKSGGALEAPGVTVEGGGGGGGGGADVGCLLFKARFSPDTSVLFINSFSRAVKNQCALHCKQFIMTGRGEEKKGGKKAQLQQN